MDIIIQAIALIITVVGSGLVLFRRLGSNEANIDNLKERMDKHENSMDQRIAAIERDVDAVLKEIKEDIREIRSDIKFMLKRGDE